MMQDTLPAPPMLQSQSAVGASGVTVSICKGVLVAPLISCVTSLTNNKPLWGVGPELVSVIVHVTSPPEGGAQDLSSCSPPSSVGSGTGSVPGSGVGNCPVAQAGFASSSWARSTQFSTFGFG